MFLARYAEKAGTGILDMIARCREAGLQAPGFRQSGGQFVQTLGRTPVGSASGATLHDEAHEPMTDLERQLLTVCVQGPRSSPELLRDVGYRSRTGNFKKAISRLLSRRLLEMTHPQKPRAKSQRYRLTRAGAKWLKKMKK